MEQEEVGLALGLSLGSGHHQLKEQPSPSSHSCTLLEPSLSLRLPAKDSPAARVRIAAVKRELRMEEDDEATDRALYSVASSALVAPDDDEGCNSRKKLRLTKEQSALLEDRFKEHSTLNPQKAALAKQLNLRPRQVEVWFQNRRARTKLKQTEVDCELLKRCCETLTEENRRLHRELQQLRTLNHPHTAAFFMPAATLSICPSCERLTGAPATTTTNGADRPKASGPGRATHLFNPFANSAAC
ncbi:hypothetical protein PVAP13_9KG239900 [Panicum virgatum]|uniref:Homeobox domain-containing protein n=1 Tax=Panicum virgatum TaxID=38727 RepID=A0A8T0NJG1_PANVG|nr:hypothetical protein PVAP13_9KG239900 [Panicum virgatum]